MPSTTAEPIVSLGEAQAFVRVETGEEEAVLAGLIRTASALCEEFVGQAIISRPFVETVEVSGCWKRMTTVPVRSIDRVDAVRGDGTTASLTVAAYSLDIDAGGAGWVKSAEASTRRLRVGGRCGLAGAQNEVPESLRQGVLRLVAHLFANRDGDKGEPPAAVTALWRPYRRMRLG